MELRFATDDELLCCRQSITRQMLRHGHDPDAMAFNLDPNELINEIEAELLNRIPQHFKSQIPVSLPMKVIKLHTNNPRYPAVVRVLKYFLSKGYNIIVEGLETLKTKPGKNAASPRPETIVLNPTIDHRYFGRLMTAGYFNLHLKNRELFVVGKELDRIEIIDGNGRHWLIYESWGR